MFKAISNWWNKLPPLYQFIIIIVVAIIVVRLYKNYQLQQKAQTSSVVAKAELKVLEEKGVKPSYAQYTFDSWADKLYNAMKGWGTDEPMIFSVFKMLKNDADFITLDRTYGVRDKETMRQWLRGDLSTSDINVINSMMSSKGITKRV